MKKFGGLSFGVLRSGVGLFQKFMICVSEEFAKAEMPNVEFLDLSIILKAVEFLAPSIILKANDKTKPDNPKL